MKLLGVLGMIISCMALFWAAISFGFELAIILFLLILGNNWERMAVNYLENKIDNIPNSEIEIIMDYDFEKPVTYKGFKAQINKLMFLHNLDPDQREEYIQQWYIIFKENKHQTVSEFVDFQFPFDEVNLSSHNYCKK